MGIGEARVEDGVLTEDVSHAGCGLLVIDSDVAVAVAASWSGNIGRRADDAMMLTVAAEEGGTGAEGVVHSEITLVIDEGI